uniref:Gypsy retrotransposon integrase-like protein 1 n=1 Tax=Xenopus tropicalis TaxID=8364 RepID=A0A803JIM9_XENTR
MEDVIKALIQSTAVQQETNRQAAQSVAALQQLVVQHGESVATLAKIQKESTETLVRQLAEVQAEAREEQQAAVQMVQQEIQALSEKVNANPVATQQANKLIRASHYLQKMAATDDVEAYLLAFERTAEREGWPAGEWASLLAPFLSGEPQKAYYDLEPAEASNYNKLKAEILARLGVTAAVRAQRFHSWSFVPDKAARSQMFDLIHLARKWLQPDINSAIHIVELLVMDRFLRALPASLRRWVSQSDPQNVDQLVALVERYIAAGELSNPPRAERFSGTKILSHTRSGKTGSKLKDDGEQLGTRRQFDNTVKCFKCFEYGHMSKDCPLNVEPMQCDMSYRGKPHSLLTRKAGSDVVSCYAGKPQWCTIKVNGKEVQALLDSGSMVTLVTRSLVPQSKINHAKQVGVVCVHGDRQDYPTAQVTLSTPSGSMDYQVGVVPQLAYEVVLGRDFPYFLNLWAFVTYKSQESLRGTNDLEYAFPFADVQSDEVLRSEVGCKAPTPLQVLVGDNTSSDTEPRTSDEPERELADLEVSPVNYKSAQWEDPTLLEPRRNVQVTNGVRNNPDGSLSYPYFEVSNDLLYRVEKRGDDIHKQLLVPQAFRNTVLRLAHSHVLGGHLGVEKTKERVLRRFYWPGVFAAISNYCSSCPDCQRTAPQKAYRSPLVPLPIIDVPFDRIAMDLVGPLIKSARGHQYILVVVDYATRYPEAIPLRNTTAKSIAKELMFMFSRVGIPREILTDQGTPFMSRVTKELCKLLQIKHLRTSVYHPQSDGLVERFNKTLKTMLRRVIDKDGKNWDFLLPYLMFAIREVPQSSTGFSPFELLYGRHPRGLLDTVKETWEHETTPHRSVIEHVAQMQDRIEAIIPIVREHMLKAQEAQRNSYNRNARLRVFQPGDRVLVLVPTVENKFLATWQGPYEVIERVGVVNYKIRQPGRRKPEQIYHVNLLKPWKDREVLMATQSPDSPIDMKEVPEVNIADTLSTPQKREVREFVNRNKDVFSAMPGRTKIIEHDVITESGNRVHLKPYRIPEARREVVSREIKKMLELDVIEESQSEWSSPIVLVPKPNGEIRFCNDYRKVNAISKFDAYPMPRVDELIERLGKARYLTTIDLTKGYWQVPLTKQAREKTAFSTPDGLFQYKVLPFGLHGAPATFQRMMDRILKPHGRYAAAYLDDIVIHSTDWESHLAKVQAVVDSIRNAGLTANPAKCTIGLEEAKYLGFSIGRGLVKPQVTKVESIQNWPRPSTKKQVRTFLGLTSYYRRFIPDFATIASPLTDLTKAKAPVVVRWSTEAEEAFVKLKEALCAHPVLVAPDFRKGFIVQTDASDVGLGAVLSQEINGEEHPVYYLSRKLNSQERNYSIVEKECLAIKWALESLRYYLLGRQFRLITDHAPLTWMSQNKEKNARVTRWFLSLQPFSFTVEHRAGIKQGNADGLSRLYSLMSMVAHPSRAELGGGMCNKMAGLVVDGRYVSPRVLHSWYPGTWNN